MCLNLFRVVLKLCMRKRTLSDQGIKLFLNGMEVKRKKRNLRQMVWNLFHSDYDDSLKRVVAESLESSRSLVNDFGSETFENSLESSVSHTIKLILTHDKKMTRRQLTKNVRFFVDVMKLSFNKGDYQTAHLILFALSHPIITNLSYKLQKWAPATIKEIRLFFGGPTYSRHVEFWKTYHEENSLPSLFAFYHYIQRCEWQGKIEQMESAEKLIELFKLLNYSTKGLSEIYKQSSVSSFELEQLSYKFK